MRSIKLLFLSLISKKSKNPPLSQNYIPPSFVVCRMHISRNLTIPIYRRPIIINIIIASSNEVERIFLKPLPRPSLQASPRTSIPGALLQRLRDTLAETSLVLLAHLRLQLDEPLLPRASADEAGNLTGVLG